ncbi:MAG: ribonuclease E inhibitor RraB [Polyangiaceae bacterium]
MSFPNDADGDALRRIAERSDMSKPMDIDFAVDMPSQASAVDMARLAAQRGYRTAVEFDDASKRWACYCTKRMVPTYEGVIAAQKELDELGGPLNGHSDGWGTLGN